MNSNLKNSDLVVLNFLKLIKAILLGAVCMGIWDRPEHQDIISFFLVIGSYLAVVGAVSGVLYALTTQDETNMRLTIGIGQIVWFMGALLKTGWGIIPVLVCSVAFLAAVYYSLNISGGFRLKSGAF